MRRQNLRSLDRGDRLPFGERQLCAERASTKKLYSNPQSSCALGDLMVGKIFTNGIDGVILAISMLG